MTGARKQIWDGRATPRRVRLLSRLVLLGIALAVTQAVVRGPVATVVGGDRATSIVVEAAIAAGALVIVFGLLIWIYETARPLVQSLTWRVVDAAIPTVGTSSAAAESTRLAPGAADEPTVVAPRGDRAVPAQPADDATLRAPRDDDPTLRSV